MQEGGVSYFAQTNGTLFKIPASFCLSSSFPHDANQYKLIKAEMVCLGLNPGVAGWKGQTNPLSYGGTPNGTF